MAMLARAAHSAAGVAALEKMVARATNFLDPEPPTTSSRHCSTEPSLRCEKGAPRGDERCARKSLGKEGSM